MKKFAKIDKDRLLLGIAAPVLAVVAALVVTALVLLATGKEPFKAFQIMVSYGFKSDSQVFILNEATTYYLAGLAVAIGFRMNLFNIGVDGQYRMGAFFGAVVGGMVTLPSFLEIPLIIVVSMVVAAAWSAIAGFLKVGRGVSEVIATIMLNSIATAVISYLLQPGRLAHLNSNTNSVYTTMLPKSAWFFTMTTNPAAGPIEGFIVIAVLAGVAYWFVLSRTRFGFDLRTVGQSESAAEASGVNVKKMIVTSMIISGALAGLVGMPALLNEAHTYSDEFPTGIGFIGIAVALLGRNHPVGIGIGALLWAFLDRTSNWLEFNGYDKEIVGVIQGVIVLCVVIAYEVVRRYGLGRQQRKVGEELAAAASLKTVEKAEVTA
ncbi:ABC transporter permease [Streptomyces sp. PTM05]|uniref:ABC transporter permease n=1 Tax=Streptantibioticus parmotrematis TaxID=2873249 RepID=A0ABS7QL74_9ACTN|nr:ABC transporter permease [Streptantibioticus parmotrematis]MBY8883947.1 ABC transporter permease [Streptantibioticus parmotrematis]